MVFFREEHANKYLERDIESEVDFLLTKMETARILSAIEIEPPVLDLGFGHGVVVEALLEKFGECSVLEASPRLAEHAKLRFGQRLKVHTGYFEDFHLPEEYSTIFATGVLQMLADPVAVLRRVSQFLSPGGVIVISVANGHSIHRALGVVLGIQETVLSQTVTGERSGINQVMTPEILNRLVHESGLEVSRRLKSYVKIVSNAQMIDFSEAQFQQLFEVAEITPLEFHANMVLVCRPRS